jgi:integrase
LRGQPGSPEFIASYNEAIEQHRAPDKRRFRFIVSDYKASEGYRELAASTRDQWGKWPDRIAEYFGELSIAQFDRPEKIRPVIRR